MPIIKDEKSLERVAGEMAFSRGRGLFLKGAVRKMARQGDALEGLVKDSELDPFHVTIRFKGFNDFRSAQCTCPFKWSSMCKHAVAVLLNWLRSLPDLPETQTPNIDLPKKPKRSSYVLPEYQHRTSQKPRIQIALSASGFIGGAVKSIPFKVFIIQGTQKLQLSNFKTILNPSRSSNFSFPPLSCFTPSQQYVLNFLNELLMVDDSKTSSTPGLFRMKRLQWAVYLGIMAKCPDIDFIDTQSDQPIKIKSAQPLTLQLKIRSVSHNQWGVKAIYKDPMDPQRDFSKVHIQPGHPIWVYDEALMSFQPMQEKIVPSFLNDFLNTERVLDEPQIPYFITYVLNPLKECCEIMDESGCLSNVSFVSPVLRGRLELDYVKGTVKAKLSFAYRDYGVYPYDGKPCIERFAKNSDQEKLGWIMRDIDQENAQVHFLLQDCGFEFVKNSKIFALTGIDDVLDFVEHLPVVRERMDVFCSAAFEENLLHAKYLEPVVKFYGSGIDWFEFNAVYKTEGIDEEITHARIKKLIEEGKDFIQLKSGGVLPIPRAAFDQIEAMSGEFDHQKLHLSQLPFMMEEIHRFGLKSQVDSKVKALHEELKSFQSIGEAVLPSSLSGVLRDYQKKGFDWLVFLRKFHFGGILADEMGLGKTLQALTMIQTEIEKGNTQPSLVICPTTLVWNWQEEIKKFLPHVKVLVLHGNHRRELFDEINQAQVVITSYPLLRRDIELYKSLTFNYVILDEAQNIKNRNTQNAQVAKSLKSTMRLAMTGTPIENSIMDLWSIFDFLMPGFLGGAQGFNRRYEIPITKLQDKVQLERLSRRIMPFVLRRLKKDVIKDLPEKIEQTSYCELEPTQAKIYAKMIESARDIASKSVNEKGFEKSRMIILTLILRLRQICCHPLIAGVDLGHRSVSGKMELLKETLNELLASNHKVLIFSQFVSMLKIMEDYLKREQIPYAYMDGSSTDRQDEVVRFNNDPNLKVFLLSLKVGGVGLNLTSADTVIIYEPWWNPAVENQAIDRVHRIGQENAVLAYRLITKGTIEEKMLQLQGRKKTLMDSLVLSEETIGKKLDWEDIKFLLDLK